MAFLSWKDPYHRPERLLDPAWLLQRMVVCSPQAKHQQRGIALSSSTTRYRTEAVVSTRPPTLPKTPGTSVDASRIVFARQNCITLDGGLSCPPDYGWHNFKTIFA